MPYPEKALIRRGRQIVTEPPKIELDPMDLHDGLLARFLERLTHIVRNIRGKKQGRPQLRPLLDIVPIEYCQHDKATGQ